MTNNSELPKLRIDSQLKLKIEEALEFLNNNSEGFEITSSQFRRMALKSFSEQVLFEGLELKFRAK